MGIRGLTTFIKDKKQVNYGVSNVNIIEEVKKYKSKNNKDAVIIIEFAALVHQLSATSQSELFCGLRWNKICETLQLFMDALVKENVKLIFIRKTTNKEISDDLLTKKLNSYKKHLLVVKNVNDEKFLNELGSKNTQKWPERYSTAICSAFLKQKCSTVGEWVTIFHGHSQQEIARLAKEQDALAIISDNSDFLIYDAPYRLWTAKNINLEFVDSKNMIYTKELNRYNLRKSLNLYSNQMPLFAALCEQNPFVINELEKVHKPMEEKFKSIASIVKKYQPQFQSFVTDKVISKISKEVDYSCEIIKERLNYFSLKAVSEDDAEKEDLVLQVFKKERHYVYRVLKGYPLHLTTHYEDVNNPVFGKSQLQLRINLEKCLIGIILQEKRDSLTASELQRKIYSVKEDMSYGMEIEDPEYPEITFSCIADLTFRNKNDEMDETRNQLIKWALHCNDLNMESLLKIEKPFIPIVLTLCYLVKETNLKRSEADIILLSYYDVINETVLPDLTAPKKLKPRAFHTVFLFMSSLQNIMRLLSTVGYEEFEIHAGFDGFHYHFLYNIWEDLTESEKELYLNKIKDLRFYAFNEDT